MFLFQKRFLWPPAHTLVAFHHLADAIGVEVWVTGFPAGRGLEKRTIDGHVLVLEDVALQERTNRAWPLDLGLFNQVRPRLQTDLVHVIDNIIEVHLCELRHERTDEGHLEVEDFGQCMGDVLLLGVVVVHDVEGAGNGRVLERFRDRSVVCIGAPLGRTPQRTGGILDVQGVDLEVLGVQQLEVLLQFQMHARQANGHGEVARVVFSVDVRQAQRTVFQPGDLQQFVRSLQPPLGQVVPRLEFMGLLARTRPALVHVRRRALDVGGDATPGDLLAEGDTETTAAHLVDIVGLGMPGLAAAVDHVVELFAISSVEDARKVFCDQTLGSETCCGL